jgi:hypothetical protein
MSKQLNQAVMGAYVVTLRDGEGWEYVFHCTAEDDTHAGEQAQGAYPDDEVVDIKQEEN